MVYVNVNASDMNESATIQNSNGLALEIVG